MNILLVYPEFSSDTFWSLRHSLKFVSRKAGFPPLGLLTIAALLPREWNIKLIDENVTSLTDKDLAWAELVFVSAMIVQEANARSIAARCKALGKKVVAGGPLFTAEPDRFPEVDYLVLGEAEITLPMFLDDLACGTVHHRYISSERPDIARTPVPMWSLIDPRDYASLLVQYSRGCPFDCEFCDITIMNGRIPRVKTPSQMMDEFKALYDRGWRGTVFVVDDNFIGNKREAKKMLIELITWQKQHRYPFKLLTEASVDLADDAELMSLMSSANFGEVFLGLETPCKESLREAGKIQNVKRDLRSVVIRLQQQGLHVLGGFMVGFDHDDPKTIFRQQLEFIQEVGIPVAMVGTVIVLPGTKLWRRLHEEGRLLSEVRGNNTDGTTNFLPKMGMDNLVNGYRQLLQALYSAKNYFRRMETLIRNYHPKMAGLSFRGHDFLTIARSMWGIGVMSKARWQYWKILIKTLYTNIKALPLVFKLAIYWVHFQKVALSSQREEN